MGRANCFHSDDVAGMGHQFFDSWQLAEGGGKLRVYRAEARLDSIQLRHIQSIKSSEKRTDYNSIPASKFSSPLFISTHVSLIYLSF